MEDVIILGATVVIDGDHRDTEIDAASLTLSFEDRCYVLDTIQTTRTFKNGQTEIEVKFENGIDEETFEDCKFDLRVTDLMEPQLKAEFYFRCEVDWEYATLFVKIGEMTKAINLTLD